ncbi:hypothetical protein UFOVP142_62 [uncultured Caudovirales phage]|uniref:Uncharacterized protein n=1 Tax=uncultured Caudovirales phage TaxID=2100421 RepID=A0A6J7XJV2_9CAUD|nr:hypothetical protein UFOVP142_62 [uncultured Caudovirales phage]
MANEFNPMVISQASKDKISIKYSTYEIGDYDYRSPKGIAIEFTLDEMRHLDDALDAIDQVRGMVKQFVQTRKACVEIKEKSLRQEECVVA